MGMEGKRMKKMKMKMRSFLLERSLTDTGRAILEWLMRLLSLVILL